VGRRFFVYAEQSRDFQQVDWMYSLNKINLAAIQSAQDLGILPTHHLYGSIVISQLDLSPQSRSAVLQSSCRL